MDLDISNISHTDGQTHLGRGRRVSGWLIAARRRSVSNLSPVLTGCHVARKPCDSWVCMTERVNDRGDCVTERVNDRGDCMTERESVRQKRLYDRKECTSEEIV